MKSIMYWAWAFIFGIAFVSKCSLRDSILFYFLEFFKNEKQIALLKLDSFTYVNAGKLLSHFGSCMMLHPEENFMIAKGRFCERRGMLSGIT